MEVNGKNPPVREKIPKSLGKLIGSADNVHKNSSSELEYRSNVVVMGKGRFLRTGRVALVAGAG